MPKCIWQLSGTPALWVNTALLIVYDEHGGIYDHVVPPACTQDQFTATVNDTGTGMEFKFDRLRQYVCPQFLFRHGFEATIVDRTFDQPSIPGTVTKFFLRRLRSALTA